MTGNQPSAHHRIYLLSVWLEDEKVEKPKLRFRLEDPKTGEQQVFASPDLLFAALKTVLCELLGDIEN
jgi:hypothetical protein